MAETVSVDLTDPPLQFAPGEYFRLTTEIQYTLHVSDPSELYHVGVLFRDDDLPDWYQKPNFYLREVVELAQEQSDRLAAAFRRMPQTLPRVSRYLPKEGSPDDPRLDGPRWREHPDLVKAAAGLVRVQLRLEGEDVEPDLLYVDGDGIAWGFMAPSGAREAKRCEGARVEVVLETFLNKGQHCFPVGIVAKTRHATVHFDYSAAPSIKNVRVRLASRAERRIEGDRRVSVLTSPDYRAEAGKEWEFFFWRE